MAHTAPIGLGKAGKTLWKGIAGPKKWELRADELRVLEDACREADLVSVLDAGLILAISRGDLTVKGSQGQDVINPLISELRQHRATLAGLLRQLKLPDENAAQTAGALSAQNRANVTQGRWAKRTA